LQWALAHPQALAALGQAGQARARRRFSWEAVAEAHERIFANPTALRDDDRFDESSAALKAQD
jgi:glycosyltransferase involved in cell wall biosynthesis